MSPSAAYLICFMFFSTYQLVPEENRDYVQECWNQQFSKFNLYPDIPYPRPPYNINQWFTKRFR
jgi:hypothetical protein